MLVPEFILPYLVLFTMFCLNWSPVVKLYTYILFFIFSALCHCKVLLFLSPLPSNAAHYLFFMQITDFPAPPPLFSAYISPLCPPLPMLDKGMRPFVHQWQAYSETRRMRVTSSPGATLYLLSKPRLRSSARPAFFPS